MRLLPTGDEKDSGVTQAYESVLIVTLTQPDSSDPDFVEFANEVKRRAWAEFGYIFGAEEEVRPCFVTGVSFDIISQI